MDKAISKNQLNLGVWALPKSGKSTIQGNLISNSGFLSQSDLTKYKEEIESQGKPASSLYSYIFDNTFQSKNKSTSMDLKYSQFQTEQHIFTMIDAPLARDLIKPGYPMDLKLSAGIIIVPPSVDILADEKGDAIKERILVAHMLGLQRLILCINKMDDETIKYSEEKYQEVYIHLISLLERMKLNPQNYIIMPVSGLTGDNIIEKSPQMEWYKGQSLLDILNSTPIPRRIQILSMPLRIPIQDTYIINKKVVVVGRVETGVLKSGMKVTFAPNNMKATVAGIQIHGENLSEVKPGPDTIGFEVQGVTKKDIKRGFLCGDAMNDPPKTVTEFLAKILIENQENEITIGNRVLISCHTSHFKSKIKEIVAKIDKTEKVLESSPQKINAKDIILVKLTPEKPISIETYSEYPELGKISVRAIEKGEKMGATIGGGVVKEVVKD